MNGVFVRILVSSVILSFCFIATSPLKVSSNGWIQRKVKLRPTSEAHATRKKRPSNQEVLKQNAIKKPVQPCFRRTCLHKKFFQQLLSEKTLPSTKEHLLFLISIDGLAYRFLQNPNLELPNLRSLIKQGILAKSQTIFPSMTWPAHATIVSGLLPREHGIIGNRWYHRRYRYTVYPHYHNVEKHRTFETVYDLAFQKGMHPAALMWPNTQGAKTITYNLPEMYSKKQMRRFVSKDMRRFIRRHSSYSWGHVQRLLPAENHWTDKMVTKMAIRMLELKEKRPRFFLLHYLGLDSLLHQKPPTETYVKEGLEKIDKEIGYLLKALKKKRLLAKSTFLVVSDHGFTQVDRSIDIRHLLRKYARKEAFRKARYWLSEKNLKVINNGHVSFVYFRKQDKSLEPLFEAIGKHPLMKKILRPAEYNAYGLPTPKEMRRSPDFMAVTKRYAYFHSHSHKAVTYRKVTGMHGFFPEHPELSIPLILSGAGFPQLQKELSLHNLDIAPIIRRILR